MRELSIFIFEDNEGHFFNVLTGLAEELSQGATVTWFSKPPPTAIPNRKTKPYCPFDYSSPTHSKPKVFTVEGGEYQQTYLVKEQWYQSDFDAAILDIYYESKSSTDAMVGLEYLKWFEMAGFIGPVFLMSLNNIPYSIHHSLPRLFRLSKSATNYTSELAMILNEYEEVRRQSLLPSTGAFGFQANTQIKQYRTFDEIHGGKSNLQNVPTLWVSETMDDELRKVFLQYIDIHPHRELVNTQQQVTQRYSTVNLDVFVALIDQIVERKIKVNSLELILIDVGQSLLVDHVEVILEAIRRLHDPANPKKKLPVVAVFCDDTVDLNFGHFEKVRQHCISILPRKLCRRNPAEWACNALDALVTALHNFRVLKETFGIRFGKDSSAENQPNIINNSLRHLLSTYLDVLVFARNKSRIYGERDTIAICPWVGKHPLNYPMVNSGLIKQMSDLRTTLVNKRIADEKRLAGLRL